MDLHKIIRRRRRGRKTVLIAIRITPEISTWLRNKDYSPTGIFHEAIKQLGYEEREEYFPYPKKGRKYWGRRK